MVNRQDMIRFLGFIARVHPKPAEVDMLIDFYRKDISWVHLVWFARMEGVAGFLYYHLKHLNIADPPKALQTHSENAYFQTAKSTLAIVSEARLLSDRLQQSRLPVVALQGLSLMKLYKDPGLRTIGDIDLMVRPDDKQQLLELLGQAGYRVNISAYPDLLFGNGIWVDIHTHILNLDRIKSRRYLFPEDLTAMWQKAVPMFDHPEGLLCLAPFDNFVALAAHALKHGYSRLKWLVDLHEYLLELTRASDGWYNLIECSRRWEQERVVCYSLMLVEKMFNLILPAWVKRELGFYRLSTLEKYLLDLRLNGFCSPILCNVLWLTNIKRLGDKIKFLKETAFPGDEIMAQIFTDRSWTGKRSGYFQRIAEIVSVCKDLHQAALFSFKKS
jgi:hypothetical protein